MYVEISNSTLNLRKFTLYKSKYLIILSMILLFLFNLI